MALALKTRLQFRQICWVVSAYLVAAAAAAFFFADDGEDFDDAYLHWLMFLPILLMLYAFLEVGGGKFAGLRFWSRLPGPMRLAAGAIVLALFIAGVVVITAYMRGHAPTP